MIILHLTRGENSPKVCLSLPATPESEAEAFGRLGSISTDVSSIHIEAAASSIQNLPQYINPLDLNGTDYEKLKWLAGQIEGMTQLEQQIFYGALDAESINGLDDILRVADSVNTYELIEGVSSDRNLGGYLVENNLLDVKFPKEVQPYLDYVSIGADYYNSHGGAYTMNGYVKRKEEPQTLESGRETIFTLRLCSHGGVYQDTISLPASEKVFSASMLKLKVTDMDDVLVTELSSPIPGLAEALPGDGIALKYAADMSNTLEEIRQTRCGMDTFFAALEASEPDSFEDALDIAIDLDDYELVDYSEYEYGRATLERLGADLELLDAIDGYVDYDSLGRDAMRADGVRITQYGLVKRLSKPFPEQEQGQTMM